MIAIQTTKTYESENCYISPSLHKKKKDKKRQRVVRFSPLVHVKPTLSFHDMTKEEITKTWLQEEEVYQIRKRCRDLIAYADNHHNHSNSYKYCIRGLESHTKYGKELKDRNRYESKMLVLDEQDQQYLDDSFDDEKIASVYKEISQQCQLRAIYIAQKDRRDVDRYYKKDRHESSATTTIRRSTGIITLSKTIASAA